MDELSKPQEEDASLFEDKNCWLQGVLCTAVLLYCAIHWKDWVYGNIFDSIAMPLNGVLSEPYQNYMERILHLNRVSHCNLKR